MGLCAHLPHNVRGFMEEGGGETGSVGAGWGRPASSGDWTRGVEGEGRKEVVEREGG